MNTRAMDIPHFYIESVKSNIKNSNYKLVIDIFKRMQEENELTYDYTTKEITKITKNPDLNILKELEDAYIVTEDHQLKLFNKVELFRGGINIELNIDFFTLYIQSITTNNKVTVNNEVVKDLKGQSTVIIYLMCKMFSKGNKKENKIERIRTIRNITPDIEKLKGKLGITQNYSSSNDFINRVLNTAIKEINKKSDIILNLEYTMSQKDWNSKKQYINKIRINIDGEIIQKNYYGTYNKYLTNKEVEEYRERLKNGSSN